MYNGYPITGELSSYLQFGTSVNGRFNFHRCTNLYTLFCGLHNMRQSFTVFFNFLARCQKAVLKQLELGDNIARNTALSENVFMMVVCIELRIPLFVVGKPGSSKSLAKTVVADNMEGDASRSDLFKTFKQVTSS